MVYGLVMRVRSNGKMKQFGALDSYGNVVRMTYSELMKQVKKGNFVNLAPNGDYYIGKGYNLADIPLFDDNMNQIGGMNYENFFNILANTIYKENIDRELKNQTKEQERQDKEQQEYIEQQRKKQLQEEKVFKQVTANEKSDIDKGLEVIDKLSNDLKREANKRLNHGKYLQYLEKVEELIDNIDNIVTECIRAKTTSNNNLRNSRETLYNRKMDAITNDEQLNHYILVHGVIELRNKAAAYYTQARQLIENELTTADREFYLNRLSQCKVYIHKIQELHKETSSILKENVANKERAERELKQVQEDAKIINNIKYKLTLLIPKIQGINYIQGSLKASLDKLDNINNELDSLYKDASINSNVLQNLEAGFAEIMQAIEEKQSQLEESHRQYEEEQEIQRLEKERQEEEKKAIDEEKRIQTEQEKKEKDEEKRIIEGAILVTNESLRNISKATNIEDATRLIDNCIEQLDNINIFNRDKIEKLKQTFIDKASKIVYKLKSQQDSIETYNINFEEYTKVSKEIEQSQSINNINDISKAFSKQTKINIYKSSNKDLIQKLKNNIEEINNRAKKHIEELINITTNNLKNLVQALKNIKESILKSSTQMIAENESEQRASLETALQNIKEYITSDINIEHIKYESYLRESESLYEEAISKIDKAIKKLQTEEEHKLKIIEREQYILNLIAEQPIVDTEEDLRGKLSKIERSLSIQDSKLGIIDVSSLDSVKNSLDEYKKACEIKITERIQKEKLEETVRKIRLKIIDLSITDNEEVKQRAISSIKEECTSKNIDINNYPELTEELEIYISKCNDAIAKKSSYKQRMNEIINKINSLEVTSDLKVCKSNISSVLTDIGYGDRQRTDIKKAVQKYESKCKKEASKSVHAKQQDLLLETRIKTKLNRITAESKIKSANTEEALRGVREDLQYNLDKAYRTIHDHMFLDDSKSIQCAKLLDSYASSMEDKLNEKLLKIVTKKAKHIELDDLLEKYTDNIAFDHRYVMPRYIFENILKLIHGHFYNESHNISEDTTDYIFDASHETQNILKDYFIEAIKYLLDNTSLDALDMLLKSVDESFDTILDDKYINGVYYLENRMDNISNEMTIDNMRSAWLNNLEELLEDTKHTIENYDKSENIEPLRLYANQLGGLNDLSNLFML